MGWCRMVAATACHSCHVWRVPCPEGRQVPLSITMSLKELSLVLHDDYTIVDICTIGAASRFVNFDILSCMTRKTITALIVLVLVVGLGVYGYMTYRAPESASVSNGDQASVEAVVENFGSKLKMVSLLAPDAAAQIQTQYASYVSAELLQKWEADPSTAPGRSTSSPWPEKIVIVSITPSTTGNAFETYNVEGNVVEVTSAPANSGAQTQPAAVYPVSMQVHKIDRSGQWLITSFERGAYSELPQQMSITGIWECLPHKDTTGPQTMECAFGIAKDQSDGHYAIDTSLMSTYPVDFATGTHVRVQGIVTPANQLNSIQKYDIDGVIQATSIQKI